MAIYQLSARRLVAAGGLAVTLIAAPVVTMLSAPGAGFAACANGESEDTFTTNCVPDLVPNSPTFSSTSPGGLPAVNLPGGGGSIPCTGGNAGQCIGLAEESQSEGPQAPPESSVGSSPTVHGSIG